MQTVRDLYGKLFKLELELNRDANKLRVSELLYIMMFDLNKAVNSFGGNTCREIPLSNLNNATL